MCARIKIYHLNKFVSFNFVYRGTMGFSGQMNGWGLCAKYSLFVANFVIFVSRKFPFNSIKFDMKLISKIKKSN